MAGEGKRLYPVAKRPKPLTPVAGVTLAEHAMHQFARGLDVTRFIIILGHEAEAVEVHLQALASRYEVTADFVLADDWQLGNGASTLSAKELTGNQPFYLSMGDLLFDSEIGRRLRRLPLAEGEACLAADRDRDALFDPQDVTGVKLVGRKVIEIDNDMQSWDAAVLGLFLCTADLFDAIEKAAARNRYELADAFKELATAGRLHAADVTGHKWLDVDSPEAHLEAERRQSFNMNEA